MGSIDSAKQVQGSLGTIGAWVYPNGESAGKVVYGNALDSSGVVLQIDVTGTTVTFERFNVSNGNHYFNQVTIPDNAWTHVGMRTATGSFCASYVNGVLSTFSAYDWTNEATANLQFYVNLNGAMRYLWYSHSVFTTAELGSIMQDPQRGLMLSFFAVGTTFYPLLPGGSRLVAFGTAQPTVTVNGTVNERSDLPSPPYNWSSGLDDQEISVPVPAPLVIGGAGAAGAIDRRSLAATGSRLNRRR